MFWIQSRSKDKIKVRLKMLQTAVHFRAASQSAIILCDISSWCNSNNSTYLFFTYPSFSDEGCNCLNLQLSLWHERKKKNILGVHFLAFSTASSFYILFALSMVLQAISSCFKAKMCWHFISGRSVMSFLFSHVLLLFTCGTHTGATPCQFPTRWLVEVHVDASFLAGFSRAEC